MDTELLYLARGGKEDIFIKCPKQQHIVHGIRFLYRQFIKKKPGVILNDSNGQSRRTQMVLFVSAIRPLLERPLLILCEEGDESKWKEYFELWTNMANDITTDTKNPFAQKVSVYIGTVYDINKYCSREWSGVIIDSDVILKDILKASLKAQFKVWITGNDMKNDLTIFSQLYKWLYPKETFDAKMFQYNRRDPSDVVAKAIMLDSFMEDVVIMSNIMKTPEFPKVTRKNKDATGTKIKKTKRKNRISSSEDDSPTKVSKNNITASDDNNYKQNASKTVGDSNIKFRTAVDDSKSTVDDKRAAIDHTRFTKEDGSRATIVDTSANIGDNKATKDVPSATLNKTRATIDILCDKKVDSSKIRKQSYNRDQPNDQRDKINKISENTPINCDEDNNSMDLLLKYEVDEKYTPLVGNESNRDKKYLDQNPDSNDSAYDKDTQENYDEMVKLIDDWQGSINDCAKTSGKKNKPLISDEIAETTPNDEIIPNNNEIENETDLKPKELTKEVKESEDLFSTESMKTLNKITNQNVTSEQQSVLNINENEVDKQKETSKQMKLHSEDIFSTESMSVLNKVANKSDVGKGDVGHNVETDASSSLDAKIKQMEELAMKKFKGSLLDSIF